MSITSDKIQLYINYFRKGILRVFKRSHFFIYYETFFVGVWFEASHFSPIPAPFQPSLAASMFQRRPGP